jgi:hypothetical protein
MVVKQKRRYTVHILLGLFLGLTAYWFYGNNQPEPELFDPKSTSLTLLKERLKGLRNMLTEDLSRDDLYENGYMALLVGWALLKSTGKSAVDSILDSASSDHLPEFAAFYSKECEVCVQAGQMQGFHAFDVHQNPEYSKIWKLVAPKGCKETLPLFLNLQTGSFLCGHSSIEQVTRWKNGVTSLPAAQIEPSAISPPRTVKDWIQTTFSAARIK